MLCRNLQEQAAYEKKMGVVHLIGFLIAVAWIVMVVGNPFTHAFIPNPEREARRIPAHVAESKMQAIIDRALANPKYTEDQYQRDIRQELGTLSTYGGIQTDGARDQLMAHVKECGSDYYGMHAAYMRWMASPEGQAAYRKGGIYAPLASKINWGWILAQGFLFCMPAFLIFLVRIAAWSRSWREGVALLWATRTELCLSTLFWVIGLSVYKPEESLGNRVEQAAAELRNFRGLSVRRITLPHVGMPQLPEIDFGQLRALSPLQSILHLLQYIWEPTGQSWHRLLMIWRRPVWNAICVSVMASLIMLLSPSRAAAAELTEKEGGPTFLGLLWTATYPIDPGAPPGHHVFWLFKEGDVAVFNIHDPALSVLELAPRPLNVRWGDASGTVGPFVNLHLESSTPTRFGLESVLRWQLGRDTEVKGPMYLYLTGEGHRAGFFTPNLRLLHRVDDNLKIGAATTLGYERGSGLSCLFGPAAEVKVGKNSSVLFRFGEWLAGPNKGAKQFRTDLVISF